MVKRIACVLVVLMLVAVPVLAEEVEAVGVVDSSPGFLASAKALIVPAIAAALLAMAAAMWKRLMDFLRDKIETSTFVKNAAWEVRLDRWARQAVDFVEKYGNDWFKENEHKFPSANKMTMAKEIIRQKAAAAGGAVGEADAEIAVEHALAAKVAASDFVAAAGSSSVSVSRPKASKPK